MKCKITLIGLAFIILLFPGPSARAHISQEEALQRTAGEIYDLVMCPICAGQTIGQSNSETSTQMRDLVLKKLRQGETKEEILQYFISRYGERIIARPLKKGLNLTLWFFPGLFVLFTAILIYRVIRRWSKGSRTEPDVLSQEALLEAYEERLEKELKDFDG